MPLLDLLVLELGTMAGEGVKTSAASDFPKLGGAVKASSEQLFTIAAEAQRADFPCVSLHRSNLQPHFHVPELHAMIRAASGQYGTEMVKTDAGDLF